MNSNETSILPHAVTLSLVAQAEQLAADVLEEKGEVYPPTAILMDVISTVVDNCEFEAELRITKDGYLLAFPQSVETDEVLAGMATGFEVIREMTLEA